MNSSKEYADDFFSFMNLIHKNNHNVNVSTITILCHLDVECLDIQAFSNSFTHEHVTIKYSTTPKDFIVTKRGKVKKSFFNQVTLNYEDISKKSIKIFSNGKLQITGIASKVESEHVVSSVVKWINDTLSLNVKPTKIYMGMINSNFSVGRCIDLTRLNRILNNDEHVVSIYNPESYPAINMKYTTNDARISVFIFGTGNVVITGAKYIDHITQTYTFLMHTLTQHSEVLRSVNERARKQEILIDGYTIRQYQSCVY